MPLCARCGKKLSAQIKFCPECGNPVAGSASAPPPPPRDYGKSVRDGVGGLRYFAKNTADHSGGIDPLDIAGNRAMGGLAYLLFFLPLIVCPDSEYGRFHANQSLLLWLAGIATNIALNILSALLGRISYGLVYITMIFSAVAWILLLVLGIMGVINGFKGKAKELPVIGRYQIIK